MPLSHIELAPLATLSPSSLQVQHALRGLSVARRGVEEAPPAAPPAAPAQELRQREQR